MNMPRKGHPYDSAFFVTPCNEHAYKVVHDVRAWIENRLIIAADHGAGKSHLATVWQDDTLAVRCKASELKSESLPDFAHNQHIIIEDIDYYKPQQGYNQISSSDQEKNLLHLLNLCAQNKTYALMTSTLVPSRWPIQIADLLSRLQASTLVKIERPDDLIMRKLLTKFFVERQIVVNEKIINYLMTRLERSFSAIGKAVDHIDSYCLCEHKPLTITTIRSVLYGEEGTDEQHIGQE
jgi:chromosomal replication initiation ATPase DnaA